MAQPNVVREPSMDEILASIRRIIESNEPVPSGIAGMPEPEGFAGSAANDDLEDVPLTIDEAFAPRAENFRPPMHDIPPVELTAPAHYGMPQDIEAPQQQRSLSLADVAARVRAASERNPGLRDMSPKPVHEDTAPATSPLTTGRIPAGAGAAPPVRAAADWNELVSHVEDRQYADDAVMEPDSALEPVAESADVEPADVSSLISADAGQQVARSFQDLAVAIDQAERRSYDDIAADLLRPMLQEWLDENLPTLVERLVREEIERVARGNRR
ncbi:MAG: DUF2497 domain-containing protein [Rhizobium sp.]|nr:DUF2497 domain-containing protein [Rhizobium sp.]